MNKKIITDLLELKNRIIILLFPIYVFGQIPDSLIKNDFLDIKIYQYKNEIFLSMKNTTSDTIQIFSAINHDKPIRLHYLLEYSRDSLNQKSNYGIFTNVIENPFFFLSEDRYLLIPPKTCTHIYYGNSIKKRYVYFEMLLRFRYKKKYYFIKKKTNEIKIE